MLHQAGEAHSSVIDGTVSPGGPGIMVLSSLLQPLHMNRRAVTLLSDLVPDSPKAQEPINGTVTLPPPIVDLAGKILSVLRRRAESGETGQCEICYLADNSSKQLVIRCIGLPSGNGLEDARVVFVLNDTNGNYGNTNSIAVGTS